MKITKISVQKLFGVFDHEIKFNENGITIVIGENGLGKTAILEATNSFFGRAYGFFKDLSFHQFSFYFENGECWEITKKVGDRAFSLWLVRAIEGRDGKEIKAKPIKIAEIENDPPAAKSRRERDELLLRSYHLERYERDLLAHAQHNSEIITGWRDFERLQMLTASRRFLKDDISIPKWFTDAHKKVSVKLIETQRIITAKEQGGESYVNTVTKSSRELIENINKIEKSANDIATDLDSTYPNRLVQKLKQKTVDSFDELNTALQKLDERRKLLSSVGLIESSHDSDLLQLGQQQENLVNPLKLYIDDSHKKLAPYEDISKKIKLFLEIINKRFKHKTLEVNKNHGFVFRSTVKRDNSGQLEKISALKLSSGEQNELILFYELIFKSNAGDTILIDEPELSLHISWQNKFIKDLKDVTSMNKVSILIATHSPDIIDDNWDLKVELKGVE